MELNFGCESVNGDNKSYSIVIPDVHGDVKALQDSMRLALSFCKGSNLQVEDIICLGDFVDRGTSSFEVIRTALLYRQRFAAKGIDIITLAGNHEVMMINAIFGRGSSSFFNWMYNGGFYTLLSFVNAIGLESARRILFLITSFLERHPLRFFDENIAKMKKFYYDNEYDLLDLLDTLQDNPILRKFLNGLDLSYKQGTDLYVHAGFNSKFLQSRDYLLQKRWLHDVNLDFKRALQLALNGDFVFFDAFDCSLSLRNKTSFSSPFWMRKKEFRDLTELDKATLARYMSVVGVNRMIVGHSIVEDPFEFTISEIEGAALKVIFADTGMSEVFNTGYSSQCLIVPCSTGMDSSIQSVWTSDCLGEVVPLFEL